MNCVGGGCGCVCARSRIAFTAQRDLPCLFPCTSPDLCSLWSPFLAGTDLYQCLLRLISCGLWTVSLIWGEGGRAVQHGWSRETPLCAFLHALHNPPPPFGVVRALPLKECSNGHKLHDLVRTAIQFAWQGDPFHYHMSCLCKARVLFQLTSLACPDQRLDINPRPLSEHRQKMNFDGAFAKKRVAFCQRVHF